MFCFRSARSALLVRSVSSAILAQTRGHRREKSCGSASGCTRARCSSTTAAICSGSTSSSPRASVRSPRRGDPRVLGPPSDRRAARRHRLSLASGVELRGIGGPRNRLDVSTGADTGLRRVFLDTVRRMRVAACPAPGPRGVRRCSSSGCGGDDDDSAATATSASRDRPQPSDAAQNACPVDGCEVTITDVATEGDELRVTWSANFDARLLEEPHSRLLEHLHRRPGLERRGGARRDPGRVGPDGRLSRVRHRRRRLDERSRRIDDHLRDRRRS